MLKKKLARAYGQHWIIPTNKKAWAQQTHRSRGWVATVEHHFPRCKKKHNISAAVERVLHFFAKKDLFGALISGSPNSLLYPAWMNEDCEDACTLQYMTIKNRTNYRLREAGRKLCGYGQHEMVSKIYSKITKAWPGALVQKSIIVIPSLNVRVLVQLVKDTASDLDATARKHWTFCAVDASATTPAVLGATAPAR